jgi:hypothetical protein
MRYKKKNEARFSINIQDIILNIQIINKNDSDENEEEVKDSIKKQFVIPGSTQTTDESEEEESDLAKEWITPGGCRVLNLILFFSCRHTIFVHRHLFKRSN